MKSLYKKLKEYSESDYYGFHMPGHKGIYVFPRLNCHMRLILRK